MEEEREGIKIGTLCRECEIFLGPPVGFDRMCQRCYDKQVKELQQDIDYFLTNYGKAP